MMRQPIVQFLLLGAIVYGLYLLSGAGGRQDDTIVVTKNELLTFLQFRSRAFDEARAERAWNVMTREDRQQLIDDYVREEALYREALALGLDRDDFVIRQRLIQKVEFINQDEASSEPSQAQIAEYFDRHIEDYRLPASVTFSHVFFRGDVDVSAVLAALTGKPAAEALTLGDRFPYHRNYSDSSPAEVIAHFGSDFAQRLFELPVQTWRGPIRSAYGTHLVLIQRRVDSRMPELAEVQVRVTDDAARELAEKQLDAAVSGVVNQYEVEVLLDVEGYVEGDVEVKESAE